MWIRLRLDVGWRDLCYGFFSSLVPAGGQSAQEKLEAFWSKGQNDALACLSVRSGFDLLLQSLQLPAESEVLFSAITIPDMPRIAEHHGLVPVPVDVLGSDFHLDLDALRNAITARSKVLVVAHLFGARPEMREVMAVARKHDLIVVEDCAQAWCEPQWRGSEEADASLFSFGSIKTATALGGALCRVKAPSTLARMRDLQARQPVQSSASFPLKTCKFALLKAISTRVGFGWLFKVGQQLGKSVDDLLGGLTRGFSDESLLDQLRQRSSPAVLRLLRHRLKTYDAGRVRQRIKNARRIVANLGLDTSRPKLLDRRHSFWLFPFQTDCAEELIPFLSRHGFDLTQRGRLAVVPPPPDRPEIHCPVANKLLAETVFLPCYAELPDYAIDQMCELILNFTAQRSQPIYHATLAADH